MYDIYRYIAIGGLILAIIMLAVTVFIFFFLNVKDAIGYITGSDKRKAMESIKKDNVSKNKNEYKKKEKSVRNSGSQQTSRLSIQERYDAMDNSKQTAVLNHENNSSVPSEQQQSQRQSENSYIPITINEPDFVLVADITYIHSNEIIV